MTVLSKCDPLITNISLSLTRNDNAKQSRVSLTHMHTHTRTHASMRTQADLWSTEPFTIKHDLTKDFARKSHKNDNRGRTHYMEATKVLTVINCNRTGARELRRTKYS